MKESRVFGSAIEPSRRSAAYREAVRDGVAFEQKNAMLSSQAKAGSGRQKDKKFDADRGFIPPRVELSSHSCDIEA